MESQAEYGRKLMDEIQARSLEVAQKQGVTPDLFWKTVHRGMKTKKLTVALGYARLAGEYMGIKPPEKHDMRHSGGIDLRRPLTPEEEEYLQAAMNADKDTSKQGA